MDESHMLEHIDGLIIDLDGTVYTGQKVIDGAPAAIERLRAAGKKLVFLSNRGNISRAMCRDRLAEMGIRADEPEIAMTSSVTAQYLKDRHPGCRVWVLGEQGLMDELMMAGLEKAKTPEEADWLVITLHENVSYRDLNMAFKSVRSGAHIIATNADRFFMGDEGECIDVAGMIGAITNSTGREVDVVVGKPARHMADAALRVLGVPAERCLIIGDSYESDIGLGRAAGIQTALVLTGNTRREQLDQLEHAPDYIWDSIADVVNMR